MCAEKRKIVLAFDSFKGSLSSAEVADAFADGFSSIVPDSCFVKVAVGDGGEGTAEALMRALHCTSVSAVVQGPLGAPVTARYGISRDDGSAVMEMAAASGLTLLQEEERNPWLASTYGTGHLIAHALDRGCRRFLVGIGGSATNDAGVGMLRALGFRLLDARGYELVGGGNILASIAQIDASRAHPALADAQFTIACDVDNPLYGERGAAFVFAPQKGADAAMVRRLDDGLRNFARVAHACTGVDVSQLPGAGAAGGLGAAFVAFMGARLVRGVEMVLDALHFGELVAGASLVVTGEGRIDKQTLMGKVPCGVLRAAQGVPVVAVGGSVEWCDELCSAGFAAIHAATPPSQPLSEAMQPSVAAENVRRCAAVVAMEFKTVQ